MIHWAKKAFRPRWNCKTDQSCSFGKIWSLHLECWVSSSQVPRPTLRLNDFQVSRGTWLCLTKHQGHRRSGAEKGKQCLGSLRRLCLAMFVRFARLGVRIGVSFLDERCTKFTIFYVFLFNQMRKVWCYGLQFCCLHSTFYNLLCIYKLWYTRDSCTTCILSILEFHMFYFILHIKSNSPLWYKLFLFWYQASLPGRGEGLK